MEVTQGPQLLREWLDKHRLSQRDLADRVGVSQAAISKIINGKVRPGLRPPRGPLPSPPGAGPILA